MSAIFTHLEIMIINLPQKTETLPIDFDIVRSFLHESATNEAKTI